MSWFGRLPNLPTSVPAPRSVLFLAANESSCTLQSRVSERRSPKRRISAYLPTRVRGVAFSFVWLGISPVRSDHSLSLLCDLVHPQGRGLAAQMFSPDSVLLNLNREKTRRALMDCSSVRYSPTTKALYSASQRTENGGSGARHVVTRPKVTREIDTFFVGGNLGESGVLLPQTTSSIATGLKLTEELKMNTSSESPSSPQAAARQLTRLAAPTTTPQPLPSSRSLSISSSSSTSSLPPPRRLSSSSEETEDPSPLPSPFSARVPKGIVERAAALAASKTPQRSLSADLARSRADSFKWSKFEGMGVIELDLSQGDLRRSGA